MLPDKTLIISPHPDDEVLLAAGIISRAVKENKSVWVALVTNGDYMCPDYKKGSQRLRESLDALTFLGMKETEMFFFGYPDTGMEPELSFLARLLVEKDGDKILPSPSSCVTYGIINGKQDYSMERTGRHAPYCRNSLEKDLDGLLLSLKPDLVITTSNWDVHGDHKSLSAFIKKALKGYYKKTKNAPVLWEGLIHSPAGDDNWPLCDDADTSADASLCNAFEVPGHTIASNLPGRSSGRFSMPKDLEVSTGLFWNQRLCLPLLEEDIRQERKKQAILYYHTALNPDEPTVIRYLLSFAKEEEVFWQTDYL